MTQFSEIHARCRCDHMAPPARVLRSVNFNRDLARKLSYLHLSGDATVDLVLTELLYCHRGRLFGPDGMPIVLDTDDAAEVARWDRIFSQDQRRFVNRFKERAADGEFKNRLQRRLVFAVSMTHLAMAIRECRLSGQCAVE